MATPESKTPAQEECLAVADGLQHQSPLRRLSSWLLSPIGGGGEAKAAGAKRLSRGEEEELAGEDVTPSPQKKTRLFSSAGSDEFQASGLISSVEKSGSRTARDKRKAVWKTDAKNGGSLTEDGAGKKSPSSTEGTAAEKPKKSRLSSLFSPMFKLLGVANGEVGEAAIGREAKGSAVSHTDRTDNMRSAEENVGASGAANASNEITDKEQRPELELCDESSEDFSATEIQPINESGRLSLPGIEASNTSDTTVVDGGQAMAICDEVQDLDNEGDSKNIEEDECDEFDPYMFIFTLPPLETVELPDIQPLPSLRTRSSNKKITLVLDLDETLVHSTMEPADDIDFSFEVMFNNQMYSVFVRQRPYLQEFLRAVSEMFEVVVFTASARVYAEKLLKIIDPRREYIKHRFYRESCVFVDGNYLKDLRVLGRDLSRVIIVDNSPQAFGYQLDNGVPIESWFDDREDRELQKLLPFLARIEKMSDVRPAVRAKYKSRERVRRAGNRMSGMLDVGLM